jgi:hypothetical protein
MDHEQIDAWYEQKKVEYEEHYLQQVSRLEKKHKAHLTPDEAKIDKLETFLNKEKRRLKDAYLKRMDGLHKEYENRSKGRIDKELKEHFLKHRLDQFVRKNLKFIIRWKEEHEKPKKE